MNDTSLMGDIIKILIQQLQHKEWLHKSPSSNGLTILPPSSKTGSRNTPISSFIPNTYQNIANDLRRYSLLFMEQLYDTLQTALLKDNSSHDTVARFQHIV
ncbi:16880_t:CDS:2 [Funneliformis geosporum]|nr:16880_t:CDS:2 [Funneliformis geosporum]